MFKNIPKLAAAFIAVSALTVSAFALASGLSQKEDEEQSSASYETDSPESIESGTAAVYHNSLVPQPGYPYFEPALIPSYRTEPEEENTESTSEPLPENADGSLPPPKDPSISQEIPPEGVIEGEGYESENESSDTEEYERLLDVPYINQRNGFPNGCESVSAVMALQYFGIDIDPNTFIEKYLDMGRSLYWKNGEANACDPREMFPGDPRNDSGWGCYPEVIKKAIDKMELEELEAVVLKDASLSTLCSEYIDNDIPVVFWGTIDMQKPSSWVTWRIDDGSGRTHTWTSPFHCLLLVGYDETYYYFNDPWRSKDKRYDRASVEKAYSGLGREALVILKSEKN